MAPETAVSGAGGNSSAIVALQQQAIELWH